MEPPKIADRKPIVVSVEAGQTYYWCSCGLSQRQPFCDGSHRATPYTPLPYKAAETKDAYLCMCKYTKNPPHCDGSHTKLPQAETTPSAGLPQSDASRSHHSIPEATQEEPTLKQIHELSVNGLEVVGHHGELAAMGVPRPTLPNWDEIQILTAQFATKPLMEDIQVKTELVLGPRAKKPLVMKIPLFVSDMSFGSLSEEAKIALATGAELVGTGICSGEGGMLPEEQQANCRYLYELASAKFGYREELMTRVQAFHFKGGQGAKTGTGGHLPANKVTAKIAQVRNLPEKTPAISPPTFSDLETPKEFKRFGDRIREISGGIPIGMKISANHIEEDIEFALKADVDYIILDGRGGGTGAAPVLFRDHISVPTIPALARARHYLNKRRRQDVTLIITGGLRLPADFVKAMALGADGVALSNTALQSIGCVAARMCHTNNCPAGIATQDPELRQNLKIQPAAERLARFLRSATELMQVMARACGHDQLNQFNRHDLTTWNQTMAALSGIPFSGYDSAR